MPARRYNPWWTVLTSLVGLLVGAGAITVFAPSVFMKPVAQELGFGRGVISSAISLAQIVMGLFTPLLGRLIDRRGVRSVLVVSIILFAVSTASLSLLNRSVVVLMTLFAIQGLIGAGQSLVPYAKIVTARFDAQRGLALGIALAGTGLGTAIVPQLSRFLVQNFGWRTGYIGLGAIILLALIPVGIFFGETPEEKIARERPTESRQGLPGMEFSEALRTPKYWVITAGFFLGLTVVNGMIIHVVPLLTDRGLPLTVATAALSASGLAMIGGRVFSGFLLDKVFASYVAVFFLLCPMVGVAILGSGVAGAGPLVGTVLVGMAVGGEFDLMAFMIGRYFGVRSFGALHGLMMTFAVFANALGSSLLGWCYQLKHSYGPALVIFEIFLLVAIVLLARLGPYRYPAVKRGAVKEVEQLAVAES
jgi:MFS family permease